MQKLRVEIEELLEQKNENDKKIDTWHKWSQKAVPKIDKLTSEIQILCDKKNHLATEAGQQELAERQGQAEKNEKRVKFVEHYFKNINKNGFCLADLEFFKNF
ncbi:hypothetical protein HN954_00855 [bacterium]|jgi:hypothetical protein|nr:hypothetical protein [bacterium]MBT6831584.1 hypothetical protein [bacterium]MBT6995963.1 hypothetical protein [bacterium]MBT7772262.1 hypothetical protein [bacterium]